MNPIFNQSDLVGEWKYGRSKLLLKSDGTAEISVSNSMQLKLGIDNGEGYWRKNGDFNLVLGSNAVNFTSKNTVFRVIQYAGNYRLVIGDYEDPDIWDGDLGFKHGSN